MKTIVSTLMMLLFFTGSFAQVKKKTKATTQQSNTTTTTPVVAAATPVVKQKPWKPKQDGYIVTSDSLLAKIDSTAGKPVPLPEIRPQDRVFTKRVWRMIDFRDLGNKVLTSPTTNIIKIIYDAVSEGTLDLHEIDDESFAKRPVSAARNGNDLSYADTLFRGVNLNTNELNSDNAEAFKNNFVGIRIKEDWVLDSRRGVFEPRIVGIAPIRLDVKSQNEKGEPLVDANGLPAPEMREQPTGWIRFEELRPILAATKIANDDNDNSGITFDDIFIKRLFFSYITKESNSSDKRIIDLEINGKVLNDRERLLEAERIKKKMADFEQGLWQY